MKTKFVWENSIDETARRVLATGERKVLFYAVFLS
jgi:hypothetical protein